mmetsp:Transcript_26481/g.81410  ORF Transcript_26481/g.81410 Transcript_26481/m.81410 type:complete len:91 (+) Transcript_26481:254-526(+)
MTWSARRLFSSTFSSDGAAYLVRSILEPKTTKLGSMTCAREYSCPVPLAGTRRNALPLYGAAVAQGCPGPAPKRPPQLVLLSQKFMIKNK